MKLYSAGPITMDEETLALSAKQLPYFRNDDFSKIMLESDEILKNLLGTKSSTKSMYLTASGTAAMEAAVINLLTKKDKVLIIDGGTFGKRFVKLCEIYGVPHKAIVVPPGKAFTQEMLYAHKNQNFTVMLINLHETSTGQLYDIEWISSFCKDQKICLVVDAISTFLVDHYNMDRYGIAATIISSQKGLGLAPGLSMLYVNEDTYKKRVENKIPITLYMNFSDYSTDILRGQTPYTPAVGIILQLHEKLKRIEKYPLQSIINKNAEIANHFREKLENEGFLYPNYPLSNGITPIYCPKNNAEIIMNELIKRWAIYVLPNPKPLNNSSFRAGHMGMSISLDDMDYLLERLKIVFNI